MTTITTNRTGPSTWVDKYADLLYRYALNKVQDKTIAEDLVQDTFLAGLKSWERFEGLSAEKTWLFAIMKNQIALYFRSKSKTDKMILHAFVADEQGYQTLFSPKGGWYPESVPNHWGSDPDETTDKIAFNQVLSACLSVLNEASRRLFLLKFLENTTPKEICHTLQISESNYWVILHRTKLQLRQCLTKNWFDKK